MPRGRKEDRRVGGGPAPAPGEAGVELDVLPGPEKLLKGPAAETEGTSAGSAGVLPYVNSCESLLCCSWFPSMVTCTVDPGRTKSALEASTGGASGRDALASDCWGDGLIALAESVKSKSSGCSELDDALPREVCCCMNGIGMMWLRFAG